MTCPAKGPYGDDIYTEPDADPDTLSNLGPLAPLAGVWEGVGGKDEHPGAGGIERDTFVERYELQPVDRQTNGPQLFYGLRYHTHIVKPGEIETFHDQVGYWLWEPATHNIILTLGIPRGQVLMAGGAAAADATEFEVNAAVGSEVFGILSNPFLDQVFRTLSYRMSVTVHPDGTWSYEEEGVLAIPDRAEPFSHIDRNTLTQVGVPIPNPLAQADAGSEGLGIGDLRSEGRTCS
ncbi:MAG TPA: heme-binding beta-barrel domain-containing protein [Acidimicrobiales bacterium]|nr:heme-binding beta-barrel domain-containing protein [Acidimicrobiales bacterium]